MLINLDDLLGGVGVTPQSAIQNNGQTMGTGIDDLLNGIGNGTATTSNFNTPVNNALLDIFGGPQL